jgi:hypothetical protein
VTALHFGLSAAVVGAVVVAWTFLAVDSVHWAVLLLTVGLGAAIGGVLLASVGAVELLLFGMF